jgi:hypothetical protein
VASNIFFILLLPPNVAQDFLALYPFISAFVGVLTIYFGARGALKAFSFYSAFIVIPIAVILFEFSLMAAISLFYVWVIYLADYLSSQAFRKAGIISYRFLNSFCIFPMVVGYETTEGFYISIGLRIVVSMFVIGFTLSKKLDPQRLSILSPIEYIISTHIAYFLPLFLVPIMTILEDIKVWYTLDQIILGAYLKYFDYRIRSNATIKLFEKYKYALPLLISTALLSINVFSLNIVNTTVIVLSLLVLHLVNKKYLKQI